MPKLTTKFVQSISTPGTYPDNAYGLSLLVNGPNSKSWKQRFTIKGQRRVDRGLGSAKYITLKEAREKAFENARLGSQGIDPKSLESKHQDGINFREAAECKFKELEGTYKNPKDYQAFWNSLETHAIPTLGVIPVKDLSSSEIRNLILSLRKTIPSGVNKVQQRINQVMKWAVAEDLRSDNPAAPDQLALPASAHKARNQASLPYHGISAFITAIDNCEAARSTKAAIKFIILTACRSKEVREASWDEIHLDHTTPHWTIPASRMKMKRDHRVPLSSEAIAVLKEMLTYEYKSDLVFPGMKLNKPLSDMTLLKLVKRHGGDITIHGFRSTFRTWAQEQTDIAPEVAEAALAHNNMSTVEAAYARSDLFGKRQELMDSWAKFCKKT